jgi:two-component system, NarL family, sensor histidine kinase DevS
MPHSSIEDPTTLRRILDATLLIEADLDLPVLLHHVAQEARSMTGARYGALGVLNDDRSGFSEFITVGLDPDEEDGIGPRPTGRGVLGLLIADPVPFRLAELGSHAESHGFPERHPLMTSFLGVPIKVRDEIYGNLYLTDKIGWSEFTRDDEALVSALAVAAGVAIENARLHRRAQEMAVYDERDRLARDLHDTVIQRFFAVGLALQGIAAASEIADDSGPHNSMISERLNRVISDIDDSIRQLRSTIFALGLIGTEQGLRARVISLMDELRIVVGFAVPSSFDGPVDTSIPDDIAEHLLHALREGVTNVARHARASEASIHLAVTDDRCRLVIIDDGRGMDENTPSEGKLGLVNLRRRAEKLHGSFDVESPSSGGTVLTWQVPLGA